MIIEREIRHEFKKLVESYPVVTITGPRQAGKTTLAKMEYPHYRYCNLENPEIRRLSTDDPRAFFHEFKYPLIIDEVQRNPELLSYIQVIVDEKDEKVYKRSRELVPIEIKSAKTWNRNLCKGIDYFRKISPNAGEGYLIYSGDLTPDVDAVKVRNFTRTYEIFE